MFCLFTVIEIAHGEYNVDLGKLMAGAVKKYYEERDTYDLGTFNRHNYIRAETGKCYFRLVIQLNVN